MYLAKWLSETMQKLGAAGVDSPRRDALVLLEDTLQQDRSWVLAHPEYNLPASKLAQVDKLIERRISREPLAYIRGKAWFYGRFFDVSPDVMIPRPESESFIELLKDLKPRSIADIGTGSGCLVITAKLELPHAKVFAVDNSKKALGIAEKNAKKHNSDITFLYGSLCEPLLAGNYIPEVLIANLPYVPKGLITSPEITQEPAEALFSGPDGLDHYREFFRQFTEHSQILDVRYVLIESLESQHKELEKLAAESGFTLQQTNLLVQVFEKI